jgi:hypothetical protein
MKKSISSCKFPRETAARMLELPQDAQVDDDVIAENYTQSKKKNSGSILGVSR